MTTKLVVAIVHGMGDQTRKFAEQITADVQDRLRKLGVDPASVFFCPLFWADVLEGPEKELWDKEAASGTLAWTKLRYFVLHNLADAVAYRREPGKQTDSKYVEIQARIRTALREAGAKAGDETLPVVVLAHSLGGAIMSDYIWDRQRRTEAGEGVMDRLANLVGMVTFGCNIPLFTLALPSVQPILLPADDLDPRYDGIRHLIEWHNFYDKDDVLGWPLAKVYGPREDGKPGPKIVDHKINVGGLTTSWNPMCHGEYWTDRDFTGPVSDLLAALVKALPGEA